MNAPTTLSRLSEAELLRLISSPEVSRRLANPIGEGIQVTALSDRKGTYVVSGSQGDFIVRLAGDAAHLADSSIWQTHLVQPASRCRYAPTSEYAP